MIASDENTELSDSLRPMRDSRSRGSSRDRDVATVGTPSTITSQARLGPPEMDRNNVTPDVETPRGGTRLELKSDGVIMFYKCCLAAAVIAIVATFYLMFKRIIDLEAFVRNFRSSSAFELNDYPGCKITCNNIACPNQCPTGPAGRDGTNGTNGLSIQGFKGDTGLSGTNGTDGADGDYQSHIYGSGTDGDITLDGRTLSTGPITGSGLSYSLNQDADIHRLSLSMNTVLNTANFRLFVLTYLNFSQNSIIQNNGVSGSGSTGGVAPVAGTLGAGSNGGAGGSGAAGTAGTAVTFALGVIGGAGGQGSGTRLGGAGGAITANVASEGGVSALQFFPHFLTGRSYTTGTELRVGSGGGGGGSTNAAAHAGGGGSSAGVMIISARSIVFATGATSATIQANGGDGASATGSQNAGGGGGGSGGYIVLKTGSALPGGLTVQANGGTGGTHLNTGVDGSAGGAGVVQIMYLP